MALDFRLAAPVPATNSQVISLPDGTGDYDAVTNPGGFGAPNPVRSDVSAATLTVTLPDGTQQTEDVLANYAFIETETEMLYTPAFPDGAPVGTVITGATNATPIVVTTSGAHGLATGDPAAVIRVQGNIAANGYWTMTVPSTTTLSLDGSAGSGAYTSGGVVMESPSPVALTDGVYLFQVDITVSGTDYTSSVYFLHTALVECCISTYANSINATDCSSKKYEKFMDMKTQLDLAQYAFDCGEYARAQTIIARLSTICEDCGCGCGGNC